MADVPFVVADVDGAAALRRSLARAGAAAEDLKAANATAAQVVAAAAAERAPRRSGALTATVRGNRAKGSAVVRAGGAKVPYAAPIHWGWPSRGIAPNTFVTDAAIATEPVWLPAYIADLQAILDKVKGA